MKKFLSLCAVSMIFAAVLSDSEVMAQSKDIQDLKAMISLQQNQLNSQQNLLNKLLNPPCDGTLSANKDTCYKLFKNEQSAFHAEMSCIAWGGRLASIHSEAESNLIASIAPGEVGTWIGAIRTPSGFAWTDGTPFNDFTHWFGQEPNNAGNIENCALTGFHAADRWGDFDCNLTARFVCKRAMKKF